MVSVRRFVVAGCATSLVIALLTMGSMTGSGAVPATAGTGGWRVVTSPSVGSTVNQLNGVTCVNLSNCVAVGISASGTPEYRTLIEAWNGTSWSTVTSPDTGGSTDVDYLNAVACSGAAQCMAVGQVATTTNVTAQTLIESWNGSAWSIVPSPNFPGSTADNLYGVACPSASYCIAVGEWGSSSSGGSLIETWNGSAWSVETDASDLGGPHAVWCGSPIDCATVGYGPTVATWNGTTWTTVDAPVPDGYTTFAAISCTGPSFCFAGGSWLEPQGGNPPLFVPEGLDETWNGSTWSYIAGSQYITNGVSCPTATACTLATTGAPATWNGSAVTPVTNPYAPSSGLLAISCLGRHDCVATGLADPMGSNSLSLIESKRSPLPACWVSASIPGPPAQTQLTVQDTAGLQSITVTLARNDTVSVPSFTAGTTNPVVVTATTIVQSERASFHIRVTDTTGRSVICS